MIRLHTLPLVLSLALCCMLPASAQQAPESTQIDSEITAFQEFFMRRFADLQLADFARGVVALPQDNRRAQSWNMLMWAPPHEHIMQAARVDYNTISARGLSLTECMNDYPPANQFPLALKGRVTTVRSAIARCLKRMGISGSRLDPKRLTHLVAVHREQANRQGMSVNINDPVIQASYARGREVYWTERGQNALSCASCHINNAGNSLRGSVISPALGQGTGFPVYSLAHVRGSAQGNGLLSLHERYGLCNVLAGAAPLPEQHRDYVALEVYQAVMNRGVPLASPGFRH